MKRTLIALALAALALIALGLIGHQIMSGNAEAAPEVTIPTAPELDMDMFNKEASVVKAPKPQELSVEEIEEVGVDMYESYAPTVSLDIPTAPKTLAEMITEDTAQMDCSVLDLGQRSDCRKARRLARNGQLGK